MARKKKETKMTMEMPGTLGHPKVILPEREEVWPKVTKGRYSTRTEYKDGTVDFNTDWKALGAHVKEVFKNMDK